jgi:hypothetical protein
LLGIWEKIGVAALAAGLRLWSLWLLNPRPTGWDLAGQLGGFALAATILWTMLQLGWILLRARIREDRDELQSLRVETTALREELTTLKDTDPKLKILLICAGLGKEILQKDVRTADHFAARMSGSKSFDTYLNDVVYPSLSEVEQNRIKFVTWKLPADVSPFSQAHENRWCQVKAMVDVIDGIIEEIHRDAKTRR